MNARRTLLLPLFLLITFFIEGQEILFVGNSLTYTNNLPRILQEIALEFDDEIKTIALCYPNYAIEDHLNDGNVQYLLANKNFDYLVVQQGPSSQPEGRRMLLEEGKLLKTFCDKGSVKLAYFMVWPAQKWYQTFDLVIQNHTDAAETNSAVLFPVGLVWKLYNAQVAGAKPYGADGFHPSKEGSFLAALSMYHFLKPDKELQFLSPEFYKKWISDENRFLQLVRIIESVDH